MQLQPILNQLLHGRAFDLMPHPNNGPSLRLSPPSGYARGTEDWYAYSSDFITTIRSIKVDKNISEHSLGVGRLLFYYQLSGAREIEIEGERPFHFNDSTLTVMYFPKGSEFNTVWKKGRDENLVALGMWPTQMPNGYDNALGQIPLWTNMLSNSKDITWIELPMTVLMEQAAKQLIAPEIHPQLLQNYLYMKSKELLSFGIDALLNTESKNSAWIIRQKFDRAISLVDELREAPTITELAAMVALPTSFLARQLKEETGMTLRDYVVERRMRKAQLLLQLTIKPLKQIAYEAGYNHTSNFCIAYKRRFGKTPKETRENSLHMLHLVDPESQ